MTAGTWTNGAVQAGAVQAGAVQAGAVGIGNGPEGVGTVPSVGPGDDAPSVTAGVTSGDATIDATGELPARLAVDLASELIRVRSVNPPGGERAAIDVVAAHLRSAGVHFAGVQVQVYPWGEDRANLVARLPGEDPKAPALVLSGHLDTVGLGEQPWSTDPFGGVIVGDRLYGRGASDMKGGVAAMVVAFERLSRTWSKDPGRRPVVLALTSGEETGCQGAELLIDTLPTVGAIVVGEATAGRVVAGHKGVMWARLVAQGRNAHDATPHLGLNAVTGVANVVSRLPGTKAAAATAAVTDELGAPTITPTMISGGSGRNVVPDACECTLDVRLTTTFDADAALRTVREAIAGEPGVDLEVDLVVPPVLTAEDDPWLRSVVLATGEDVGEGPRSRRVVNYFTDASVLGPALGSPPVCILGPGQPELAHQVDEWCSIDAIQEAVKTYEAIATVWGHETCKSG